MRITYFIFLLTILLSLSACVKEPVIVAAKVYDCEHLLENTHPKSDLFDIFIKDRMLDGLPGMTMLIDSPEGFWAGAAGYADISNKIPMQVCNISRIGSVTKTFTATLILQLMEEGQLQLDDVMSQYLSADLASKITNSDKITIRQLLDHTSGLADFFDNIQYSVDYFNDPSKPISAMEELRYIFNQPAKFEPGIQRQYTNINFVLLGMIAENITGKMGATLYRERIFRPLGMTNTFFKQDTNIPTAIVRGYSDEEGNKVLIDRTEMAFAHTSMAGGIVSNVLDLKKYMQAIVTQEGGLLNSAIVNDLNVVKPTAGKDATLSTKDYSFKNAGIGLGWFNLKGNTPDRNAVGHGGSMRGYQAFIAYFPATQTTLCYLVNGNDGQLDYLEDEMRGNELMALLFE